MSSSQHVNGLLSPGEKVDLIREYASQYPGLRDFVETGLYDGHGTGMECRELFDKYIAIDLDEENCGKATAEGRIIICGDSGSELEWILSGKLDKTIGISPMLFWLDAHYVGELDGNEKMEQNPCPLLEELYAIKMWPHGAKSVVLIDDLRMLGSPWWPTLENVHSMVEDTKIWNIEEKDDIMRLTPR